LEYRGIGKNKREKYWFLITNFTLTKDNVYQIMRGGRARHKIENETFNTLKNQGYYYEHNFGYEQKHLTTVLAYLMMIAFFIDQLQQLGCKTFKKALDRLKSKSNLWEKMRGFFFMFYIDKTEQLWHALVQEPHGPNIYIILHKKPP
jgi:hypothetical protein